MRRVKEKSTDLSSCGQQKLTSQFLAKINQGNSNILHLVGSWRLRVVVPAKERARKEYGRIEPRGK